MKQSPNGSKISTDRSERIEAEPLTYVVLACVYHFDEPNTAGKGEQEMVATRSRSSHTLVAPEEENRVIAVVTGANRASPLSSHFCVAHIPQWHWPRHMSNTAI